MSDAWNIDQSGLPAGERKDLARFILNRIDRRMLRGERRRLRLSNAAIDADRLRPVLARLDACFIRGRTAGHVAFMRPRLNGEG